MPITEEDVAPHFAFCLKKYGNSHRLARELGVSRQNVEYWAKTSGFIPEWLALDVERITKGKIDARQVLEEAKAIRDAVRELQGRGPRA